MVRRNLPCRMKTTGLTHRGITRGPRRLGELNPTILPGLPEGLSWVLEATRRMVTSTEEDEKKMKRKKEVRVRS